MYKGFVGLSVWDLLHINTLTIELAIGAYQERREVINYFFSLRSSVNRCIKSFSLVFVNICVYFWPRQLVSKQAPDKSQTLANL